MSGAVEQAKSAVGTVQRSMPLRAYKRYGQARGNVLAGGIAYFAFFSLIPAVTVSLTVLGLVMNGVPEVRDWVVRNLVDGINQYAPGLVNQGQRPAGPAGENAQGIYVDEFLGGSQLTFTLIVSLATGLFTGLGWVDGLRQGVRAVFGEDTDAGNFLLVRLRDLLGMVIIGFGVLLSAVALVATNAAGDFVLDLLGFEPSTWSSWTLRVLGIVVSLAIDTATFLAVFRFLPGADVPVRDLIQGAVLGGIGIGLLKQFGTTIARRSADGNPVLGSAVTLVVLLVLMNLIARLALLAAAWAATRAEEHGSLNPDLMAQARLTVPLGPEAPDGFAVPERRRRAPFVSGLVVGAVSAAALRRVGRR
ncbi:YihY/virulence factor BrkB family protein [Kineococcus sp. LSe6-4]|uniref:YihY/virulence factor BrkB family protein n=1 Tax=Kineococcus halophytocola TaxID=3234027 RepID=A0ABV4H3R3_9ACTN